MDSVVRVCCVVIRLEPGANVGVVLFSCAIVVAMSRDVVGWSGVLRATSGAILARSMLC